MYYSFDFCSTRKPSLSSLLQLHDFTGENISGYSLDFCACKQHLSSLLCCDTVSLVWLGVRNECIYIISGFRAITRAASANQNVTNNIPLEKYEEWPPYVPHRLKHSYGAQNWMIPSRTDNIHKSSCSLRARSTSYNQLRQILFICMNAGFRVRPSSVHQSTHYYYC